LRIVVDRFAANRSQRRNWKQNANLRVVVQPPTITPQHLALYNAFHGDMKHRRGWDEQTIDAEEYFQSFVAGGGAFAREFLYFDGSRLVGVGLADVLTDALSSVYFYHMPEYRSQGLGVFSVLKQLEFAREHNLRHQYLGYWISACQSMAYKAQYRPHEVLVGSPDDSEEPVWQEPREAK
jgi:arginine-tRNA-protein transferase